MKTNRSAPPRASRIASALALALLLASSAPLLAARGGADPAREMWMGGYLKYEEATKTEASNNPALALDLYREALAVFQKVQARYPEWNPSLLDYRMNYCREHIRRLEATVSAQSTKLSKEGLVSLTQSQDARIRELTQGVADLKKRLELAEKSLEQARVEAAAKAASAAETDRVLQENAALRQAGLAAARREEELKSEVERLRSESGLKQKHAELQQTLDVTLAAKADLERREKEYKAAAERLASQLRVAALGREQAAAEAKPLKEAVQSLRKDLASREEAAAALRKELEAQKKQQAKDEKNLAALRRDAEALGKKSEKLEAALREAEARRAAKPDDAAAKALFARYEADLKQAQGEAAAVRKALGEKERLVADAVEQLNKFDEENARLNRQLDTLQKRNAEQAAALEAAARSPDAARADALARDLAAVRKAGEDTSAELNDIRAKYGQGLQLARSQQAKITDLEKAAAVQAKALADGDAKARSLTADLKLARDRIAAMEGLLPGKGDVQAAMDALMVRLGKAEGDNAALDAKLKDALRELEGARKALGEARLAKAAGGGPMLEQLRTLNRELDQERDRSKALEQTVEDMKARLAAVPAAAPAAAAVVSTAPAAASPEEELRRADRAAMANGFLQGGVAAEKQGKTEAAVWNYRKVLEYQPDNRLACKRLGILASRAGNLDDAESFLRRAFYADPDDVDVLLPLGFTLVRQSKPDLALSMLARAAALRPEDTAVHGAYGVACSQLGWRDAAESQFRRTLSLNPKDKDAAFNLAVLLATANPPRLSEAQKWYRRARELGIPADPGLDKLFTAGGE